MGILLPDLRGGGVERIRIVLAYEFARAGHEVEFLLMQARGELLEEARDSFPIVDLACPRARNLPITLARYLREKKPDALLAAMWPLTVIAPVVAKLARYKGKVLISEHGIISAQYSSWGKLHRTALLTSTGAGYRLADARVGVSNGVIQDMADLAQMQPSVFTTINNPVPPRPEPTIKTIENTEALWGVAPGGRVVTVGTLKAVKNQDLLIRAFAKLNRSDARLMIVGDGELRADLEVLCSKLGVADQVIFAGFQNDPTPFYATADLFVLSSNYEGFGNVIVEALACGTPVVSTDCPSGPAEILENGRWGGLSPVGDVDALAVAIDAALKELHDPAALKARAAQFAPEIAAQKYLDALGFE